MLTRCIVETARREDESQQGQTGTDFRVQGVTVDEMWVAVGAGNGQMRWREGKVLGGKTLSVKKPCWRRVIR